MELENVSWVELSIYDWQTGTWGQWLRFDSTRDATNHVYSNLTAGTLYKIQEIRSRVFSV